MSAGTDGIGPSGAWWSSPEVWGMPAGGRGGSLEGILGQNHGAGGEIIGQKGVQRDWEIEVLEILHNKVRTFVKMSRCICRLVFL